MESLFTLAADSKQCFLVFYFTVWRIELTNTTKSARTSDSRANRKAMFNRGMVPNIPENPRGRSTPKRGRQPFFNPAIYQERFFTIERVFAWEDKFRRLLLRF